MITSDLMTPQSCCGCGVCAELCPQQAIVMKAGLDGFQYPEINSSRCIDCHKCLNLCVIKNNDRVSLSKPYRGYAAVNEDLNELRKSASGGAFAALAISFLNEGGYVCGACMSLKGTVKVEHIIIHKKEELMKLQGSKYVQSNISFILPEIKHLLLDGKKVLFSGTPCQVAGVLSYLGKHYDNLYTVDIICHGVPSPGLFSSYINYLEKRYNGKILGFKFRDKDYGWGKYGSAIIEQKNIKSKIEIPCDKSSYYSMFMNGNLQRDFCYQCPFAKEDRCSDVTLGDYWGIEKYQIKLLQENGGTVQKKNGVSAVLVNTNKGEMLINQYGHHMQLYNTNTKSIIAGNSQLRHPVPKGRLRKMIYGIYTGGGTELLKLCS